MKCAKVKDAQSTLQLHPHSRACLTRLAELTPFRLVPMRLTCTSLAAMRSPSMFRL